MTSPHPQVPPLRQGPRPLGVHLAAGMTVLLTSPAALPLWKSGSLPWRGDLRARARALIPALAAADPNDLARAVDREVRRRLDRLLTGVERYRQHPYQRDVEDPPAPWVEGSSRLLPFAEGGRGPAVLFVPSLINRGYILDLSRRRSLVRWLAREGLRPWLLEWGAPGPLERRFTLTDYIAGRLERALTAVRRMEGGRPVVLAGYCMGGLLALAAAQRRPGDVAGLALLATPWDFHADDLPAARRTAAALSPLEPVLQVLGEMPIDALQTLFAALDPQLALRKFDRFARMVPSDPEALDFVALEDWLNDGVPLAAPVARECLGRWYGANDPAGGRWLVAGDPVQPSRLTLPTLVMVPARDRIVPPASALALGASIPGAVIQRPPLGHIGMVVSGGAEAKVWQPLRDWIVATSAK